MASDLRSTSGVAEATAAADGTARMIPHHIGGQRMEGAAERRGQVYNPASGAVLAQVPFAGESEVDLAVQAAGRAQ
ncbi:MAG: hypothetical protein ACRENY_08405, partial [Candidatus Dormibacteria bacterium]